MNNSNNKFFIIVFSIVAIVYNVLFFTIFGIINHSATFWLSYVFMMISLATGFCILITVSKLNFMPKDWFLGYPIIKYSIYYVIFEFISSIIFAIFEKNISWHIPFIIQFIALCLVLVFVISAFFIKDKVNDVRKFISSSTQYMKSLRTNAKILISECDDPQLKLELERFYEATKLSDPISTKELYELETEISETIKHCRHALSIKDFEKAKALCAKASKLLFERNIKCKTFKQTSYT